MDFHVKYLFASSLAIFGFNRDEKLERKNYSLKNCMRLTLKHFNLTSHYKNPDGPCSVQPSGDCNMLPWVKCVTPFLFPCVQRIFSQDTTGWQNLYLTLSWGFREISGNAREIWDYHTSFLVDWIAKSTIFHFLG